ncbi:TIGR03750 family conjugal transfer protein [Halomonas elongata]|uniref:Secretion cluster MPF-G protein Tfc11 n=1 Tax=Halomonas elongata (strain ATCC 33173 / DSM 2581 / NBRC 15536 / NCIMB 2198 / 1H9) TaxID=768066 RepID=E1VA51_HALED|nr:TIGR03750 family conjugal transfer protein [Halomonas elongata]WBF17680.1 TIGR03750 family conjugal transfer protein [Halomonas elongata]WPU46521.1 TIGR03750 family conjugal transfer protein [Halomonas elongata DSM 2581]CBV43939.1 secretion cluster MPF-G protein Tfc11 [Halomonas elongata DSM 2581]
MATIEFIPRRLNETPIVFRGMTGREVAMVAFGGFVAFVPPGIVLAWWVGMVAVVPTVAFAGLGLSLLVGGSIMRRLRRGRPPSLLYRRLQYRLAAMGWDGSGEHLITRTTAYRLRRGRRRNGGVS